MSLLETITLLQERVTLLQERKPLLRFPMLESVDDSSGGLGALAGGQELDEQKELFSPGSAYTNHAAGISLRQSLRQA
jgi:hypothetical protein